MTIRSKLTFLFTSITLAILLGFASLIYFSSARDRESEFYKNLKQRAITKANLLLEAKIDSTTLQTIYRNTKDVLYEEEVAVYDTSFNLLYHDAVDIDFVKETRTMIREIVHNKELLLRQNDWQIIGLLIEHNGKNYVITAAAYDQYGITKLHNLRNTIILSLFGGILILFIAGYFFSDKALKPVSKMVAKVEDITATNLDLRVNEGNGKDEIAELAITFNRMLDRLESSFDSQKQFVSNISHELRTPLATIVTELELSLKKERTAEEYKRVILFTQADVQKLVKLSNSLLDLAKASYDQSEIGMKAVRLDELLLDAREAVLKANQNYKVNITFEQEIEKDDFISVNGNEYLLKVAFINLIDNGCKFSDNHVCSIGIRYFENLVILRFSDSGAGIDQRDLPYIFDSFYRGNNKQFVDGNGIGLSLTKKIITLHKGSITVTSKRETGTTFILEFPHI